MHGIDDNNSSRTKVLALDDDRMVRRILEDMLSEEYNFMAVASYGEFSEVLNSFYPDILLLDLVLPDGDGIEICGEIRGNSQYEKLFILMITAADDEESIVRGYEAGANDYIRKPFVPFEVKSKILNCKKIIGYQNKLHHAFNYQLDFSKKLYQLNRIIQKNINVSDYHNLSEEFSSLEGILDLGYMELVLMQRDEPEVIFSKAFNGSKAHVDFARLSKKPGLIDGRKKSITSVKVQSPGTTEIYCDIAPVLINNQTAGYLLVERSAPFDQEEKNLISLSTDFLGIMAERIRIQRELDRQYDMYKNEVAKVRKIQVSLLPDFHNFKDFDIASVFLPAEDISGDFFDGFYLDDDVYQIVLCDVSGHGMASSFIGNEVRSLFRTFSLRRYTPAFIINSVNDILTVDISGLYYFATVIVCQINMKTGEVLFSSGGHPPAVHYSASKKNHVLLEKTGSLIGFFEDSTFTDRSFVMGKGDSLLLYTDGVTESMCRERKELYGDNRLIENFMDNVELPSRDILHSIIGTVYEYTGFGKQEDDITMICVKKL
ncbi:MAG TPA: fused response regulator/phosphatase [Spirochaetes bacterium]|nr:fused response regulator/phosphatase [Spirochaetota bacterium]